MKLKNNMNKKAAGSEIWYVIAAVLGIIILVWFFSGPFATILHAGQKFEEFEKKYSQMTPKEQKELPAEKRAELDLKEINEDYEKTIVREPINLGDSKRLQTDLRKVKQSYLNFKKKIKVEYKDQVSAGDQSKIDSSISKIDEKLENLLKQEPRFEKEKAMEELKQKEEKAKLVEEVRRSLIGISPDVVSEYLNFKQEFDEIVNTYISYEEYQKKNGKFPITEYEKTREQFTNLLRRISISKSKDEKLLKDLEVETILAILWSNMQIRDCEKAEIQLNTLKSKLGDKYKTYTGKFAYPTFSNTGWPIGKLGQMYLLSCYYNGFREKADYTEKNNLAYSLLKSYDNYMEWISMSSSIGGFLGGESDWQKEALLYLGKVDCTQFGTKEECNANSRSGRDWFIVENYKVISFPSFEISRQDVINNKKLGCVYGKECYNCYDIKLESCEDYIYKENCEKDPCAVKSVIPGVVQGTHCNWDDGGSSLDLGIIDGAGCCIPPKTKC